MPRYDYRCDPCDEVFEIERPTSDRSEVACPSCGTIARRVFTPVGVVLKGSGFHATDYRSGSGEKKEDSPAPSCPAASSNEGCGGCPAKDS